VALEEATQARAGIAAERTETLDAARREAATAAKEALDEARTQADAMLATAKATIGQNVEVACKANAEQASDLSLMIAARLLERLNSPAVQSAFLSQLVEAITKMPAVDRAALVDDPKGIEVVTATETSAEREVIQKTIQTALGGTPNLRFVTDPDLIAGLELRSAHFILHNSWQADLTQIRKVVKDAA